MKKQPNKLNLSKETIRRLGEAGLTRVVGGIFGTRTCSGGSVCFDCIPDSEMTDCTLCV
jgi:hypothetical protein